MLSNLFHFDPYKFNYQIPRSLIAISQLINLIFTKPEYYFNLLPGLVNQDLLLSLFEFDLTFAYIISFIILLWVITGITPQISSILHFYFSFSFFYSSKIIEGADHVTLIITLLLIPICCFDKRINLWSGNMFFKYTTPFFLKAFSASCFRIIQIQIGIIYLFAAAIKVKVPHWNEGSALYYWFNHSVGASDSLKCGFNWLVNSHFFTPILTWSVLILEFLLFGALFMNVKYKNLLFYPAVVFHVLIGVVFGLWAFSITMTAALLILLTPSFLKNK